MILCAAGDVHGALDPFYEDVLAFEGRLGVPFEYVLHAGDFGIWPDPERVDRATLNHGGAGDFPAWLAHKRGAPRPTVFVKGNHEDFDWLEQRRTSSGNEVLPGLTYLPNGETIDLAAEGKAVRVGGIGGCHGPSDYERRSSDLSGRARRHFTRDEVERLCGRGGVDILLFHDAPAGVEFIWRRPDGSVRRRYASEAEGLAQAVARMRPAICFFGHHHTRIDSEIAGVRCIGLNKVGCPGNLVALRFEPGSSRIEILGEWPRLGAWPGRQV